MTTTWSTPHVCFVLALHRSPTDVVEVQAPTTAPGSATTDWWRGLRVLRLCSVFPPGMALPDSVAARFDTVGGMQTHTSELTPALDDLGVEQTIVTTRPPGTPASSQLHRQAVLERVGFPISVCRQFYAAPAGPLLHRLAAGVDLLHAHLGEDLAVGVPAAIRVAVQEIVVEREVKPPARHGGASRGDRRTVRQPGGDVLGRGIRHSDSCPVHKVDRLVNLFRTTIGSAAA